MSELPEGVPAARVPEPRDSASAVILRAAGPAGWEVLLGLRSRRSRFMPGHLAFPGGRRDPADGEPPEANRRCASREILEETGLSIDPQHWLEAGERITPPMFPARFRTWFFLAQMAEDRAAPPIPADAENEILRWVRPQEVLDEWARGETQLPPPVLPILRALETAAGRAPSEIAAEISEVNAEEQRAPRIEFAPGVWVFPVRTATLPPATHTNVWIPGGRTFVVVDPGSADAEEQRRLVDVLRRRQALGQQPLAVLLTHQHRDHASGAAALAAELGVPIRAHALVLDAWRSRLAGRELQPIEDGEWIDLDGLALQALHTPGHAPGHLAFHLPEQRLLIAGDLVSGLSTILIDPQEGDMGEFLRSCARVQALDCRLLLPGHGAPLPGAEIERVIAHRRWRGERILSLLTPEPRPLDELGRAAYAETPRMPSMLVEKQTLAHLLLLERDGQVRRDDPAGGRWSLAEGRRPTTAERIARILQERFEPLHLDLRDESAKHAGHPGATSGGGHYHAVIVSAVFEGRTRLEQHRLVHAALGELFGEEIHALALTTHPPSGWKDRG